MQHTEQSGGGKITMAKREFSAQEVKRHQDERMQRPKLYLNIVIKRKGKTNIQRRNG